MSENLHIETELIHGGYSPDKEHGATAAPIFQSASFAYETAEDMESVFGGRAPGFVYSRINNPTLSQFEKRMTVLENGIAALTCASGMAAISATVLALAGTGDEIVSGKSIFGGTYSLFANTLVRYGIKTKFVDTTDATAYQDAITDRTKLIFVETIGNPKIDVPNIKAIAEIAKKNGIVFVVDNTVATPVMLKPKSLGADIVIHSTSKYINGHGNSIGGIVVDCGTFNWSNPRYEHLEPFYKKVRQFAFMALLRNRVYRDLGFCMSPFNAFLMSIGIESLAVRMERHCSNAATIASALNNDNRIQNVRYPGLETHSDHATAKEQFNGLYGAIMTIELDDKKSCFNFMNNLKRVQILANIGDAKTLAIHPASTFCRDASESERTGMGVTDNLIRLSIGLEHVDDIIADIDQSL